MIRNEMLQIYRKIQIQANRYIDINTILHKLIQKKVVDTIYNLLQQTFFNQFQYALQKINQIKHDKPAFNIKEQLLINSLIFKDNTTLIINMIGKYYSTVESAYHSSIDKINLLIPENQHQELFKNTPHKHKENSFKQKDSQNMSKSRKYEVTLSNLSNSPINNRKNSKSPLKDQKRLKKKVSSNKKIKINK